MPKKYSVLSDLHFKDDDYYKKLRSPTAKWIREQTRDSDRVVLAGDIFDVSLAGDDKKIVRESILKSLFPHSEIIYIAGNHDYFMYELHGEHYPHIIVGDVLITHGPFFDVWYSPAHHLRAMLGIKGPGVKSTVELMHPYLSLCSTDLIDSPALQVLSENFQRFLGSGEKKKEVFGYLKNYLKHEKVSWLKRKIILVAAEYVLERAKESADRKIKFNPEYFNEYMKGVKQPIKSIVFGHTHEAKTVILNNYIIHNTGHWDNPAIASFNDDDTRNIRLKYYRGERL